MNMPWDRKQKPEVRIQKKLIDTTPWMEEVGRRRKPKPRINRMYMIKLFPLPCGERVRVDYRDVVGRVTHDCMEAGGRTNQEDRVEEAKTERGTKL